MNNIPDQPTTPPMPEKECKLIYASLARDITGREKARVDKENFENKRNEIIELINKAIHDGKYKIKYPLSIHEEIIKELYMYGYDITKETDSLGIGTITTWIISWEGEKK